jgi:hypothetical protein
MSSLRPRSASSLVMDWSDDSAGTVCVLVGFFGVGAGTDFEVTSSEWVPNREPVAGVSLPAGRGAS